MMMIKHTLIFTLLFWVAIFSLQAQQIKHVDVDEFQKAINAGGLLVDVRTEGEVKEGKIKGAKHWDWFDDNFDKNLKNLDKKKPVLLYCHSDGRSTEAAEKFQKLGFTQVYSLNKGIVAWKKAGKPVEK